MAATDQDREAVELCAHLSDEPGLADPRFAGDEYETSHSIASRSHPSGEDRSFTLPADVGRTGSEVGRAGRGFPSDIEGRHRFGQAFEL